MLAQLFLLDLDIFLSDLKEKVLGYFPMNIHNVDEPLIFISGELCRLQDYNVMENGAGGMCEIIQPTSLPQGKSDKRVLFLTVLLCVFLKTSNGGNLSSSQHLIQVLFQRQCHSN